MAMNDTIRGIVQIMRPPSEVFAYIADFRHDPAWRGEVRNVSYTTPEPVAAEGSQCVEIAKARGRKRESWLEIIRCVADASITCATFKADEKRVSERTVRRSGTGTELEIRIQYDTGQARGKLFLWPVIQVLEQRRLDRALLKLKQRLEERRIDETDGGRS